MVCDLAGAVPQHSQIQKGTLVLPIPSQIRRETPYFYLKHLTGYVTKPQISLFSLSQNIEITVYIQIILCTLCIS